MGEIGIRFNGKDPDGKGKGIEVTERGILKTYLAESVMEEFEQINNDGDSLSAIVRDVKKYNCLIVDIKGSAPLLTVTGRGVVTNGGASSYRRLPYITESRYLANENIMSEGRFYFDLRGIDSIRVLRTASQADYHLKASLSFTTPPEPLDVQVKFRRITPSDGRVDGKFRAIEPLTNIELHSDTRLFQGNNPFEMGDVRKEGQPIFGMFDRVRLTDGVALVVDVDV